MLDTISTYNGWANQETWLVNMWLGNDPGSAETIAHIVKAFEAVSEQTAELKQWVVSWEYLMTVNEASLREDLLHAALSRVDWLAIIERNQS